MSEPTSGVEGRGSKPHLLETRVLATIERHKLPADSRRWLAAVSGGPDSVAMLEVLRRLSPSLGLELEAVHVNHRRRGKAAQRDQEFVEDLCRIKGIRLHCCLLSEEEAAAAGNLAAQLRGARYRHLFSLARVRNAVLATGHQLDDQAETVLLRLFRGAGVEGLAGIPVRTRQSDVTLVRPLLEVTRDEILDYLRSRKLSFQVDASNQNLDLDRNWVRQVLMPQITQRLNPRASRALARASGIFQQINDFIKTQAGEELDRLQQPAARGLALDLRGLASQPPALRREIVRLAIERSRGSLRQISHGQIEAVVELCRGVSGRRVSLPGGWEASREFDKLVFSKPAFSQQFEYNVSIPGVFFVKEVGKRLKLEWVLPTAAPPGVSLLRLDEGDVRLRNRRPGDRIRLRGTSLRLKEFFQRNRVPVSQRSSLLILERQDEILWVEGLYTHPRCRPTGSEKRLLRLEIERVG